MTSERPSLNIVSLHDAVRIVVLNRSVHRPLMYLCIFMQHSMSLNQCSATLQKHCMLMQCHNTVSLHIDAILWCNIAVIDSTLGCSVVQVEKSPFEHDTSSRA